MGTCSVLLTIMIDICILAIICVYIEKLQLFIADSLRKDKTMPKYISKTQNMPIGDILTYHFIYEPLTNNDRYL